MSAAEAFYAVVSRDGRAILPALGEQLGAPGFDLSETLVLSDDSALVAGTALGGLAAAQSAALTHLLRHVPKDARTNFAAEMRRYMQGVEPIEAEGQYVGRVAVAPARRGEGLGRVILSEYLARFAPGSAHLHVRRDNAPAIALYRALGFERRSDRDFLFVAFTRTR